MLLLFDLLLQEYFLSIGLLHGLLGACVVRLAAVHGQTHGDLDLARGFGGGRRRTRLRVGVVGGLGLTRLLVGGGPF